MAEGAAVTQVQTALAQVKAGRGYLLSYHRLMAAHDPGLLLAYDALYRALTLSDLALTPQQREIVWLSLLVSAGQVQGRIHLDRALALGLDAGVIAQAACLVAHADAPDIVAPDIEPNLAQLCLAVSAASRWDSTALSVHLPLAIAGLGAAAAAEALCFVMIPCGIACLAHASHVWQQVANPADGTKDSLAAMLDAASTDLGQRFRAFMDCLLIRERALPPIERTTVLSALQAMHPEARLPATWHHPPHADTPAMLAALRCWASLDFVTSHWGALSVPDRDATYLATFDRACAGLVTSSSDLSGFVCQVALGEHTPARLHLARGFAGGLSAAKCAEAITYLRLHATGATFIAAVDLWAAEAGQRGWPSPFDTGETE